MPMQVQTFQIFPSQKSFPDDALAPSTVLSPTSAKTLVGKTYYQLRTQTPRWFVTWLQGRTVSYEVKNLFNRKLWLYMGVYNLC